MEFINELVALVAPYAGFAALVAVLVQLGKQYKLIADGDAGKISAALNLLGGVIVYAVSKFVVGFDFVGADNVLGEVANILTAVFAFVAQVGGSKVFYLILKSAGVSKSLSESAE